MRVILKLKMMKNYLFAILTIIFFASCQKELDKIQQTTDNTSQTNAFQRIDLSPYGARTSSPDWSEAANPAIGLRDTIGYAHNLGAYYVMGICEQTPGEETDQNRYDLTLNYYEARYGTGTKTWVTTNYPLPVVRSLNADSSSRFNNLINSLPISSNGKDRCRELINTLLDTSRVDHEIYSVIKNNIVNWEDIVLNDTILTKSDKEILLSMSSTARYTLLEYNRRYFAESGVTGRMGSSTGALIAAKKKKWWQWLIIGVCDAAGVVAGVATGNIPGGISAGAAASGCANTLMNQ
jgi:hypothetical protein